MDIKERFEQTNSLNDIAVLCRTLKAEGIPASEVNALATARRKALVGSKLSIKPIMAVKLSPSSINTEKVTHLSLNIQDINMPRIVVEGGVVTI